MTDAREFHERTRAFAPVDQLSKPSFYWAALLKAEKRANGPTAQDDYLWIRCGKKTKVSQLYAAYEGELAPNTAFILNYDDEPLARDEGLLLKDFNVYGDNVVALEVVLTPNNPKLSAARSPLMPTNRQSPQDVEMSTKAGTTDDENALGHMPSLEEANTAPRSEASTPPPPYSPRSQQSLMGPALTKAKMEPKAEDQEMTTLEAAYPKVELTGPPSQKVKDPYENIPFLLYLDQHYAANKGILGDFSVQYILDTIWDSWNALPPHERNIYLKSAQEELLGLPPASSELEHRKRLSDSKPVLSEDEAYVEDASLDIKPDIDFNDQFGDPATLDSQPIASAPRSFQLQEFIANVTLEILEASVERGVEYLDDLKHPLREKASQSAEASQWLQQIETLQKQATKTKTIVGVVGNTGAGKSSVINAMLDEERLVPTNTMRACTAVVTELSYNYSDTPYRAEIEFITEEEWKRELTVLFQDLLNENGEVSRDCTREDSDAGVAYAKIRAVYPKKTKEEIAKSNIATLLREVSSVLGKTKKLQDDDSLKFYRSLQHYVDSKEKATGKDKDKDKKQPREMEFWPLIKVVRIFVKSPVLETGVVIVDLPGVHDANAARSAVAEGYMKQCTGLWIVAPIIRAVDDKAAKNLLGGSFKRQLKMDGGFSSVTFICSKTDDISLMEASDSLNLDEQNGSLWRELEQCESTRESLKKDLKDFIETKATYGEIMSDCDDQQEVWEALMTKLEGGNIVYPPPESKKRKKSDKSTRSKRLKRHRDGEDEDDDFVDDDESNEHVTDDDEDEGFAERQGEPLTEEFITAKLMNIKATKKSARRSRLDIDEKIKGVRKEIAAVKDAEERAEAEISRVCIEGRNGYSKGAIQQDFAAGIRELDQEIAAEEDEENFNPDVEARDYDEVAKSLPVFCVSSRGYQKLKGRLKKDPKVPGFTTTDQTEIPALQAHCQQLTIAGRTAACKRFMTNVSQLLNSMTLWASNDGTGANLNEEQRAREARFLNKSIKNLESGLEKLVNNTYKELTSEFSEHIFDKYSAAISAAREAATQISAHWGAPVNRNDRAAGGLYWATYKALCRRAGVFTNTQGPHDWNGELTSPMMRILAPGWEKTFTRRVPATMAGLARNANNLLQTFHHDVSKRAQMTGTGIAGLGMLQQQLPIYVDIFRDLSVATKDSISQQQKDINREFVPIILQAMNTAYEQCADECGAGSFARMKAIMNSHVANVRGAMFKSSCDHVRDLLKTVLRNVQEFMENKADEVFSSISRDYRAALGGNAPKGEGLPKWQRDMQRAVMHHINSAEKVFKKAAGIEVKDDVGDDDAMDMSTEEAARIVKIEDDALRIAESDGKELDDTTPGTSAIKTEAPEEPLNHHDTMEEPVMEKLGLSRTLSIRSAREGTLPSESLGESDTSAAEPTTKETSVDAKSLDQDQSASMFYAAPTSNAVSNDTNDQDLPNVPTEQDDSIMETSVVETYSMDTSEQDPDETMHNPGSFHWQDSRDQCGEDDSSVASFYEAVD